MAHTSPCAMGHDTGFAPWCVIHHLQLWIRYSKPNVTELISFLQITHMKKEIDAIRAKDIAQGGLTQGQQTQIARNEQRISQVYDNLLAVLNTDDCFSLVFLTHCICNVPLSLWEIIIVLSFI